MRSACAIIFFLLSYSATAQVMGYGSDGLDGYGTQATSARRARLPRDTAYHTLGPNQLWSRQPWKDSVYSFAEFQHGRLEFTDGTVQAGKWRMNYNYFLDNVDVQQDITLEIVGLARYANIKTVHIGKHKFNFEPRFGFLEVVQEGAITVSKKRMMRCVLENSNGNKHIPYLNEDPRGTLSRETRYYWPYEIYFVTMPDGTTFRANPITLRQLVPHLDGKLKIYQRIYNPDFRKIDDIKKIVEYCNLRYNNPAIKSVVTLGEHESIERSEWKNKIYLSSSFEPARMTMEDGTSVESDTKINYNLLSGWMNMINKKGDTVLLTTTTYAFNMITDEATFFNDRVEGPMEVVILGKLGLARKPRIELIDAAKRQYGLRDRFYFIVRNKAIEASEWSIAILIPAYADQIEEFILENNINFGSKEELLKLIAFCQQLKKERS